MVGDGAENEGECASTPLSSEQAQWDSRRSARRTKAIGLRALYAEMEEHQKAIPYPAPNCMTAAEYEQFTSSYHTGQAALRKIFNAERDASYAGRQYVLKAKYIVDTMANIVRARQELEGVHKGWYLEQERLKKLAEIDKMEAALRVESNKLHKYLALHVPFHDLPYLTPLRCPQLPERHFRFLQREEVFPVSEREVQWMFARRYLEVLIALYADD